MSRSRRYRSYSPSTDGIVSVGILLMFALLCVLGTASRGVVTYTTQTQVTATVVNADIAKDGDSNLYLIDVRFDDGSTEVLAIRDNIYAGAWNSRDTYFTLKNTIGKKYTFTVVGWRVAWRSWHREIIRYEEVR